MARVRCIVAPMLLAVTVKPRAKRPFVTELRNGAFVVAVSAPPVEGRANVAVLRALAAHLKVAPSRLSIVQGHTNRNKVIQVED
jgi:uncharacterized protein (TIGR00251 family)